MERGNSNFLLLLLDQVRLFFFFFPRVGLHGMTLPGAMFPGGLAWLGHLTTARRKTQSLLLSFLFKMSASSQIALVSNSPVQPTSLI